jgi:hypothetical protein
MSAANNGMLGGAGAGLSAGASVGTIFGPVGTAVGAGVGALIGGILGWAGGKKHDSALDNAMSRVEGLPLVNPMSVGLMDSVKREIRAVESGMTNEYATAKDLLGQAQQNSLSTMTGVSGGNAAMLLESAVRLNGGMGENINKLLATVSGTKSVYMGQLASLIGEQSQRELDLETYKVAQNLARVTDDNKNFNDNMRVMMMKGLNTLSGLSLPSGSEGSTGLFDGAPGFGSKVKGSTTMPAGVSELMPTGVNNMLYNTGMPAMPDVPMQIPFSGNSLNR